jgi:AraC family transcriptional regulator
MHHLRAIQKALDLIEDRLDEPLRLRELARRVGMSLWHFQRTFSAMAGQPVGSYIRRRRLAEAARCLRTTDRRILDIALDYQFESHEAFTRAFKAEMKMAPSAWRSQSQEPLAGLERIRITLQTLNRRYQSMKLIPEIVTLSARTFIGLQTHFITPDSPAANNLDVLPRLWAEFFRRRSEISAGDGNVAYGLSDSPSARGETPAHPDEAIYLAAVEVEAGTVPPPGMEKWRSPAGSYARFIHRGPAKTIGNTMGYIYGKWLASGEAERAAGPDIERIDSRFNPHGADSVLEIFIPVRVK